MDDYLSKPLRIEDLHAVITKYQPGAATAAPAKAEPAKAEEPPAVTPDRIESLRMLETDDSGSVLTELIDTFLDSAPQIIAQAKEALWNGSGVLVARSAHTLMGSCSNFGANQLQELARQLETLARCPDFKDSSSANAQAETLLGAIDKELDRVGKALGKYRNKP
jgi:HPt (histidine-containing phosphotransfer) domain-containing protein